MRDYAKWAPTFWTGKTGHQIRESGRDVQVVAFYLGTCPSSNWIGLYYLPLPTLCHEVGISPAKAIKALERLEAIGYAFYDLKAELAWVPNAAKFQIGEELKPADNRIKKIAKDLAIYARSRFCRQFVEKYGPAYHLPAIECSDNGDGEKGLQSPSEGPPKPVTEAVAVAGAVAKAGAEIGDSGADAGAKKTTPRKRCPEDFTLTPDLRKWAASEAPGVNVDRETEKFKDYEFAKPRTDWLATWRNWIRTAAERAGNGVGPRGGAVHGSKTSGAGGSPQSPRKPFEGAPPYIPGSGRQQ